MASFCGRGFSNTCNDLLFQSPPIPLRTNVSLAPRLTSSIFQNRQRLKTKIRKLVSFPFSCLEKSPRGEFETPKQDAQQAYQSVSKIPNHFRIPFLGLFIDALLFNRSNLDLARMHGPIYTTDMIGMPVTVVSDPHAVINCLKDCDTFRSSGAFPVMFQKLFGKNMMMMSDGNDHANKRAKVSPAFTSQMIPGYFDKIHNAAFHLWNLISTSAPTSSSETNPLPLESFIRSHFLRVIVSITMGANIGEDHETVAAHADKLCSLFVTISFGANSPPIGPAWNKAVQARNDLLSMLRTITVQRLKKHKHIIDKLRKGDELAARNLIRNRQVDLLMIIIASSNLPTNNFQEESLDEAELEQIAELIVEIWFGGYFSNTSATLSSLMELEAHPEILQELRDEQELIPELTVETVSKNMPLLNSFLMEVLRIHTPVFLWYRKTSRPTDLLGYEIPTDTHIVLDLWAAQRNANYFKKPDEFNHCRFLPGSSDAASTSSLLSFGALGSTHHCVGAALAKVTLKTTLAVLIRQFDLKLVPRTSLDYLTIPEFRPKQGVNALSCKRRI